MKPVSRIHELARLAAVASCCAAVLAASAWPSAATPARHATQSCSAAATRVWLGLGLGGGTAGTYYYPLEFSNIGKRACTLYGYPGVSAYRGALKQVGPAAARNLHAHGTVMLAAGATVHATIGIHDWGALCTRSVPADGLRVYPPGQRTAQTIPFSFGACPHRSVLSVSPVTAGVGIPGYTTP